ncbi:MULTISPECIES: flagellin [Salinibacter]|uniref:flagellin N-terminal helical domain-containing protein n=1 Tax=Salinibacter TaxID=146918 RepID=UPI0021E82397|nr:MULTISPECIES: flagellin [Salinibacter]
MSSFSQINTNIQSQQAFQNLSDTSEELATRRERLSTGLRINSASDDAAGFEIAAQLEARTGSQQQALRNIGDAKSTLSTAEGALDSQLGILQSAREKATQAANGSLSQNERDAIAGELQELVGEVNDIAENTTFNGDQLIKGGTSGDSSNSVGLTFQTGSESDQTFDVNIANSTAEDLGIRQTDVDASTSVDSGGGQLVNAGDFAETAVSGVEGNVNITNGSAQTSLVNNLKGGEFDVSVEQTATDSIKLSANGNSTTITGTTTSGGETIFNGTSSETLTLSSTTGGTSATISVTGSNISIATDSLENGGEAKSFTVEVRDELDIGTRLQNAGAGEARDIIDDVDSAIDGLTSQLSDLGASQNRLSFKESNLETSQTNLNAAQSRIEDADFAREQTQVAKLQVQQQSGTAQLAQANAAGQSVLSLLQ